MTVKYLNSLAALRRYSGRTVDIYRGVLEEYEKRCGTFPDSLTVSGIRNYEVFLLDERKLSARTVGLHLSVLSGFCRFLMREGLLKSNPVRLVPRPKTEKRLPAFYREDSMLSWLESTSADAGEDTLGLLLSLPSSDPTAVALYRRRLSRLIISLLYATGLRRSELIALRRSNLDLGRKVLDVTGKGNKMREIPLIPSICRELSLYLKSVDRMVGEGLDGQSPLLLTEKGRQLYPVYVDRAVKAGLEGVEGITGRKSPHVLRHTLATELLDGGSDLNSIKELLGHSSLAATQVYTHNTVERLKNVYNNAHPRAKNGGNNGNQD